MHLSADTRKPRAKVREDLLAALAARGFEVLAVREVGATVVVEARDPSQRPEDFSPDPATAAEVPHRIAVFERPDGSTRISTLRPTRLAELVGESGASPVAALVERALGEILAAAAR